MALLRKSERLSKDKNTIRNLKAVLQMRQRLKENSPGRLINGHKLFMPVPLKTEFATNIDSARDRKVDSPTHENKLDVACSVDYLDHGGNTNRMSISRAAETYQNSKANFAAKRSLYNFSTPIMDTSLSMGGPPRNASISTLQQLKGPITFNHES